MTDASLSALPPDAEVPVLLALLGASRSGALMLQLTVLQQQLGAAVRVLRIDSGAHPLVVRSFRATDLPCFVLVRHGLELGRTCSFPSAATILELLRSCGPAPLAFLNG